MSTTAITIETLRRISDLEAKAEQSDALLGRVIMLEDRFGGLEERMAKMEEEWARTKETLENDGKKMQEEIQKGSEEREKLKSELEGKTKETKTAEDKDDHPWTSLPKEATKKCIVITDSNGRGTSANSIKNHVPREEWEGLEIEVVVAYTLEEAYHRIRRKEIEVEERIVVIDNVTNDVRKVRDPWEVKRRMGKLMEVLEGAAATVVVEVKPMRQLDVRPSMRLYINCVSLRTRCSVAAPKFGCGI